MVPPTVAPASIAPSDAPTLKMSNGFASKCLNNNAASKWLQEATRRQVNRRAQADVDVLLHNSASLATTVRPPAEPPPVDIRLRSVMTEFISPDNDTASISTTNTFQTYDSTDSLFGIPPLCTRSISSDDTSDDDDTIDEINDITYPSQAMTFERTDVETVHSDTSFDTAQDDDRSISTTESLFPNLDDLGPPPLGSLLDLWDTPFSTSCLHNFAAKEEDAKCYTFGSDTSDTASTTDTNSSAELYNDGDTYAEFNPIDPHHVHSLTRVTTLMQVVGLNFDSNSPFVAITTKSNRTGELIDTGGNFNMTNRLSDLVNVVPIKPFTIGMAAKEDKSTSVCTHRGDFPLPMLDGSTFYTLVYYNAQASDCILSPEAICYASGGLLTKWSQSGSPEVDSGQVSFYDARGAEVISLKLDKRNGLYYSSISTVAVDTNACMSSTSDSPTIGTVVYYHTPEGMDDDDISIDLDEDLCSPHRK